MYAYLKALHIIFVVTWFAGLFYMPRLLIYNAEAGSRPAAEAAVLRAQLILMMRRLWFIITWPSAVLTLVLGPLVLFLGGWQRAMAAGDASWLWIKLALVLLLYLYHFSLHALFRQQERGLFRYRSGQLRLWNEVSTLLLFGIVMLVVVKQAMSWLYGTGGILVLGVLLFLATKWYKKRREKNGSI